MFRDRHGLKSCLRIPCPNLSDALSLARCFCAQGCNPDMARGDTPASTDPMRRTIRSSEGHRNRRTIRHSRTIRRNHTSKGHGTKGRKCLNTKGCTNGSCNAMEYMPKCSSTTDSSACSNTTNFRYCKVYTDCTSPMRRRISSRNRIRSQWFPSRC